MNKTITMQQIADELNLSRRAVSSIINDHGEKLGYSKETIQRVRMHMVRRGYVPSQQAVSLKKGKQNNVGVFHSFRLYSHLIEAFNQIVSLYEDAPGIMDILTVSHEHRVAGIRELLARGISRLVWIHVLRSDLEFNNPDLGYYLDNFEQVIIYNYHFYPDDNSKELLEKGYNLVGVDRAGGYAQLTSLLYRLGHRKVALPDLNEDEEQGEDRMSFFKSAGITPFRTAPAGTPVASINETAPAYAQGIMKAIKEKGVTAVCPHDDIHAGYIIKELISNGLRVPEDITVTGYDNMPCSEILCVPLTTLAVPVTPMVNCVKKLLKNGGKQKRHCFDLELVKRKSHGPVKK